ncbi:MAG TPA: LytTR family DNA-binding domain-containing protein [Flavisolibacter sp.]|nr:LytTR family DNA-binding domain-containing protein [Flavisolibacter sp.]
MSQNSFRKPTDPLKDRVFIKDSGGLQKVLLDDILFISSKHVYITLKTCKRNFIIRGSLQHFITGLNCENLVQVHRSHVVNLHKIDSIGPDRLMIDGNEIPVSKSYKELLLCRLHIK